ncbi:MAG: hypothetical protein ACTSO4_16740, partial [Promethearchaeota archaeon]
MCNEKLDILIIEDTEEIFNYLQLGINLPVLPEFKKFILNDLKVFNSKSMLLLEDGDICGHVLIYFSDKDCLYFGFFSVINHLPKRINFLISQLINFAKENNFEKICGPINIPTLIFGWGFLEKGCRDTIFLENPSMPDIYIELFKKNNFQIYRRYLSFEGKIPRLPSEFFMEHNLDEFEFFSLKNWDEIDSLKDSILSLTISNLSPVSSITPHPEKVFDNFINIAKSFFIPELFIFIKHKKDNKIIGLCFGFPNIYQKDNNGNFNSIIGYLGIVDHHYRRKGVGYKMSDVLFENAIQNKINKLLALVSADLNIMKDIMLNLFNLTLTRKFIIF